MKSAYTLCTIDAPYYLFKQLMTREWVPSGEIVNSSWLAEVRNYEQCFPPIHINLTQPDGFRQRWAVAHHEFPQFIINRSDVMFGHRRVYHTWWET